MPQIQFYDSTPKPQEPTNMEKFFQKLGADYKNDKDRLEIGKILEEAKQNDDDMEAYKQASFALSTNPNIQPSRRLQEQENLNSIYKNLSEQKKAINQQVKGKMLTGEERERRIQNLENEGYPRYEAENFVDSPPSVQSIKEREHKELIARGVRKPLQQPSATNEMGIGKQVENIPEKTIEEEWPKVNAPPQMTNAERIKWENNNEKTNSKELKEVEKKKKAYRDNGILINSMTKVNDSKKLPSGLGKLIKIDPESGDIRPIAQLANQINPETELYVKNLKQFLKGAKDFFGARVTNFDVSSFMQQLPSLMNSEQGRRLILKQMDLVNNLESVHANELDQGIKHYGRNASYIDISKIVDNKVSKEEELLLSKINEVVKGSEYIDMMQKNPDKFKDTIMMFKDGKFKAVKKEDISFAKDKGWSEY